MVPRYHNQNDICAARHVYLVHNQMITRAPDAALSLSSSRTYRSVAQMIDVITRKTFWSLNYAWSSIPTFIFYLKRFFWIWSTNNSHFSLIRYFSMPKSTLTLSHISLAEPKAANYPGSSNHRRSPYLPKYLMAPCTTFTYSSRMKKDMHRARACEIFRSSHVSSWRRSRRRSGRYITTLWKSLKKISKFHVATHPLLSGTQSRENVNAPRNDRRRNSSTV